MSITLIIFIVSELCGHRNASKLGRWLKPYKSSTGNLPNPRSSLRRIINVTICGGVSTFARFDSPMLFLLFIQLFYDFYDSLSTVSPLSDILAFNKLIIVILYFAFTPLTCSQKFNRLSSIRPKYFILPLVHCSCIVTAISAMGTLNCHVSVGFSSRFVNSCILKYFNRFLKFICHEKFWL